MAQGQAPDSEAYPEGFPAAFGAGRVASLRLFIPGKPIPQSRPRARVQGLNSGKPWAQIYEEKPSAKYQEYVAEVARHQAVSTPAIGDDFLLPFGSCQAFVILRFNYEKPKTYPRRVTVNTRKPDLDNAAKSVLDGLVKGRILEDDNVITDLTLQKRYVSPGHPEGVEVDITVRPVEVP